MVLPSHYNIAGSQLHVRTIPRFFNFDIAHMSIIPIWVTCPNLPFNYWSARPLSWIASQVGVPINTDQLTKEKACCSYARALIHVDVSKPLVRSFRVLNTDGSTYEQQAVYEFEPRFCPQCQSLTHNQEMCKKSKPETHSETRPEQHIKAGGPFRPHGEKIRPQQPQPRKDKGNGPLQQFGVSRPNNDNLGMNRKLRGLEMDDTRNDVMEACHSGRGGTSTGAGLEVMLFRQPAVDGDGFQEVINKKKMLKRKGEEGLGSPSKNSPVLELACLEPLYTSMKIASWNVRGFNSPGTQDTVARLLKKHRIDVIGLLETKIEELAYLHQVLLIKFGGWRAMQNLDIISGGRIVVCWNPLVVDLHVVQLQNNLFIVLCTVEERRWSCRSLLSMDCIQW